MSLCLHGSTLRPPASSRWPCGHSFFSIKKTGQCARSPARTAGLGGSDFVTPRPRGFRMFLRCRRPFRNSKGPATTLAPGFRPARPHARRRVRASFGRLFALQGPSTVFASSNCQGVPELPMAVYLGLGRQSTGSHCGNSPPRPSIGPARTKRGEKGLVTMQSFDYQACRAEQEPLVPGRSGNVTGQSFRPQHLGSFLAKKCP